MPASALAPNGTLVFDAGTIRLGAGQLRIEQFATLALQATGGLLTESLGGLNTQGALTITAPVVTGAQASKLMVFDPLNRTAAPVVLNLAGEEPRAMAVSPDGNKLYVAFFESGNKTTIVGTSVQNNAVNSPLGPYGGQNPPPNDGVNFTSGASLAVSQACLSEAELGHIITMTALSLPQR